MGAAGPFRPSFLSISSCWLLWRLKKSQTWISETGDFFLDYRVRPSSAFLRCLLPPNVSQYVQMWNLIWNPPLEPLRQCNTSGTYIILKSSRELQCLEEQLKHWKLQYPNKVPSTGLRFRPNDTSQIGRPMQPSLRLGFPQVDFSFFSEPA